MENKKEFMSDFKQIILYRHVNPDLDAFGSQMGLYWVLKMLYPEKNVVLQGKMDSDILKLYDPIEDNRLIEGKTLGIVLDTANCERVDGDLSLSNYIVKIDHHIVVDSYGDINVVDESASSCSEIVTLLLQKEGIKLPISSAKALYLGIIGDSNRFLYQSTTKKTFQAASYLLDAGICIDDLYKKLYIKKKSDLDITKYIYNHYRQDGPVAWFYFSTEALNQLHITREKGSQYVNTLANVDEFRIWMAITQNDEEQNYRVSIRSRDVAVNEVANQFRGGGHAFASGATLQTLEELPLLISKLKEICYE